MSAVVGIAGAALLFVLFGLLRRGRDAGACEGCGGGCAADDGCRKSPSPQRRSTDAHS